MELKLEPIDAHCVFGERKKKYVRCTVTAPTEGQPCHLALALTLDLSSSMKGERLDLAKAALNAALDELTEQDYFCIVGYNRHSFVIHPMCLATQTNKQVARVALSIQETRIGTNLYAGWNSAIAQLSGLSQENLFKQCILFTDGCAGIGPRKIEEYQDGCNAAVSQLVYTSTVGLGEYCNHVFLRALSDQCGGKSFYVRDVQSLEEVFLRELRDNRDVFFPRVKLVFSMSSGIALTNIGPQPNFMVLNKYHIELFSQRRGQITELLLLATVFPSEKEPPSFEVEAIDHQYQRIGMSAPCTFTESPAQSNTEVATFASRFVLALGEVRLYEYRHERRKQQKVLKKLEQLLGLIDAQELWEQSYAELCSRFRRALPEADRLEFFDDCSAVIRSVDVTGVTARVKRPDKDW